MNKKPHEDIVELINKITSSRIVAIKLISGEEILASWLGEIENDGTKENTNVALYEPMIINESEAGIRINKYMKFSDSKIVILKTDKIISIGSVPNTVSDVYKTAIRFYNDIIVSELDKELSKVSKLLKASMEPVGMIETIKIPNPGSISIPGSKTKH